MTKEEPTVEECLRWLKKLETLNSDGAKLAHLKGLLNKATTLATERERKRAAKIVESWMEDEENWQPIAQAILDKEEGV